MAIWKNSHRVTFPNNSQGEAPPQRWFARHITVSHRRLFSATPVSFPGRAFWFLIFSLPSHVSANPVRLSVFISPRQPLSISPLIKASSLGSGSLLRHLGLVYGNSIGLAFLLPLPCPPQGCQQGCLSDTGIESLRHRWRGTWMHGYRWVDVELDRRTG